LIAHGFFLSVGCCFSQAQKRAKDHLFCARDFVRDVLQAGERKMPGLRVLVQIAEGANVGPQVSAGFRVRAGAPPPRQCYPIFEADSKPQKPMRLALSTALIAASLWLVVRAAVTGEPELLSLSPFGGQRGADFKTTIRGRSLDRVSSVWFDCDQLSATVGVEDDKSSAPVGGGKKKKKSSAVGNRRSFLDVIDRYYRDSVKSAEHTKMDAFRQKAQQMILTPGVREAFDLSKESDKTKDAYGRDTVGQSLLMARRLVEAGTRFVTAAGYHVNSWDTHSDNDKIHRDRLTPPLDRSLSALIDDLVERGLYDSTIVITMGEFGRTPHVNPNLDRDHWPICWSLALGGGGLRTGLAVGKSDDRGGQCIERQVRLGDVFATVYKAMGIQWDKEYMTPMGRPIKIANSLKDATGEPIKELV
jgi:hypothetical protein